MWAWGLRWKNIFLYYLVLFLAHSTKMVNGKMDCIYIAPLSKALYNFCLSFTHSYTHTHTPTAIGCHARNHARNHPARQEQLGVRCLAQGHFVTPRVGSNWQPSDCQTTALISWATSPPVIMSNLSTAPIFEVSEQWWDSWHLFCPVTSLPFSWNKASPLLIFLVKVGIRHRPQSCGGAGPGTAWAAVPVIYIQHVTFFSRCGARRDMITYRETPVTQWTEWLWWPQYSSPSLANSQSPHPSLECIGENLPFHNKSNYSMQWSLKVEVRALNTVLISLRGYLVSPWAGLIKCKQCRRLRKRSEENTDAKNGQRRTIL